MISLKKTRNEMSVWIANGIGLSVAVLELFVFICTIPILILKGVINENTIDFIAVCIQITSVFTCAIISGALAGEKWLISILTGGAVFSLLLICVGVFGFDGTSETIYIGLLSSILGMGLSLALIMLKKMKVPHRSRRKRSR